MMHGQKNIKLNALKYGSLTSSFAALNPIDYSKKMMGDFVSVANCM